MKSDFFKGFLKRFWPIGVFTVLTVILTWPHVRDIDFALPGDSSGAVNSDPLLNVWTLAQGVENIKNPSRGLFYSNAFWPRPRTLAYSDHLLGWLPFTLPLSLITNNFVLIFNLLFLLTFILSGFGAYLLVKEITGNQYAGLIGGIIFAFCPFRMTQYGHFAGLSFPWLPFAMLSVHRYLEYKQKRYLISGFFLVFLQTLCSGIYGLFFCTFLGWFLAGRAALRRSISFRSILSFGLLCLLLFGTLLPFYWPNIISQKELGFVHTEEENFRLAADVLTILGVPGNNIYQKIWPIELPPGEGMFPGLLVLVLAIFGFLRFWKKGGSARETAILYLFSALICWLFSLGPMIKWNTHPLFPGPYALLLKFVPVFKVLRMTNRFGALMMMCLAVLAGLGVKEWLQKKPHLSIRYSGLMIVFLIFEYAAIPSPLGAAPDAGGLPEVYSYLKKQPDNKVVVEIPCTHGYHDSFWMYYSMHHGKPILNGYSSFTPPEGKIAVMALIRFPSPEAIRFLNVTGADYAVVHQNILGRPIEGPLSGIKRIAEFGPDILFEIPKLTVPSSMNDLAQLDKNQIQLSSKTEPERLAGLLSSSGGPWPSNGFREFTTQLQVKFEKVRRIRKIELQFDSVADFFPVTFLVRASMDGKHWDTLSAKNLLPEFYLSARENPRRPSLVLELPAAGFYRYLALQPRLVQGLITWPLVGVTLWESID